MLRKCGCFRNGKERIPMKKLLVLAANPETSSAVMKATEMGVYTIVTDNNPNAYAKRYASKPANVNAVDVDALEALAREEQVDGVLLGVAEALMPTYAELCTRLNVPCFGTKEQFELLADKERFKRACRENGVPVVEEYPFDPAAGEAALRNIPLPVVVKPVDSSSSKGISVCKTFEELKEGIEKALEFSKSKRLLIEKYMTGEEVVIYYAFQNGEVSLLSMCDRYTNKDQKGVAQLPTSYIFPSKHLEKYRSEVDENVRNLFKNLGIQNGVMFIQSFIDEDGGVRFYEPGYRLNGAQEHYIIGATTGIDAKEMLINFALTGKMSDKRIADAADPRLNGHYACKLSPLVKLGKISKIVGLDKIAAMKEVVSVNPSYDEGDTVEGYGTLKQIICRFFVVADSSKDLQAALDRIFDCLDVLDEQGNSMMLRKFDTKVLDTYE